MARTIVKYDCVFSLGEVCFRANYLRAMHLRKFSAPFDWVAGATFAERMNMLLNNFQNFFNKKDLVYHGQREYPEPRDIYYNHRTHIMFNHDFPLLKPFDEQFDVVQKRYQHRIDHLYKKINKSKKVLIVYMETFASKLGMMTDKEICDVMKETKYKFPLQQVDLIYIRHNEDMADDEFEEHKLNDNVTIVSCYNRSRDEHKNDTAVGNYHNVRQIFKNFRCKDNPIYTFGYFISKTGRNIRKMIYRHKIKNGEEYIRILGIKVWRHKIEEPADK